MDGFHGSRVLAGWMVDRRAASRRSGDSGRTVRKARPARDLPSADLSRSSVGRFSDSPRPRSKVTRPNNRWKSATCAARRASIGFSGEGLEIAVAQLRRVLALATRAFVSSIETGGRHQQQRHRVAILRHQTGVGDADPPALMPRHDAGFETHPFAIRRGIEGWRTFDPIRMRVRRRTAGHFQIPSPAFTSCGSNEPRFALNEIFPGWSAVRRTMIARSGWEAKISRL